MDKRTELNDELRPEYDETLLKNGNRGKYAERYTTGSNIVRLDLDVASAFPNEKAVNDALRSVLKREKYGDIAMSTTIEGVYHNGKIELSETPRDVCEGTRVIVTFPSPGSIDLRERGIDKTQAAELRARLACFAEDWEDPEMSVYDNYDEEKAKLQTR